MPTRRGIWSCCGPHPEPRTISRRLAALAAVLEAYQARLDGVLGSVAGDDTILVVARDADRATALVGTLLGDAGLVEAESAPDSGEDEP